MGDLAADIYKFCEACKFKPTHQQRQLLDAVMDAVHGRGPAKIAVKSGQGPGKSTASGVVGLWRLLTPYSKLVVTAPTMRQCKDVWLAEAKATLRRADPRLRALYNVTGTGIGMCGHKQDEWGCLLVTATTSAGAQGQHRKDMDVIEEEASGISHEMDQQYKGTLSNPGALFLKIGNPNTRDCPFFDCFSTQAHKWRTFTWNAEETPASEWFNPQNVVDLAEEFGKESDVYRIRVLGEFPFADPNCVISLEDVMKCMDRPRLLLPCMRINPSVKQFGLDFSRFGGDESAIFRRSGNSIVEWWWGAKVDPNDVVDKAFRMQIEAGWRDNMCRYVADAGGMGQGVMGNFHRANKHVVEFHNNGKAAKADYDNKITQGWFQLARMLREDKACLPKDNILMRQLSTRQYFVNNKGKLVLESKPDYVKRGHESPDRADACVLAYWDHGTAEGQFASAQGTTRRVGQI
jgi:phage terminase large subunit